MISSSLVTKHALLRRAVVTINRSLGSLCSLPSLFRIHGGSLVESIRVPIDSGNTLIPGYFRCSATQADKSMGISRSPLAAFNAISQTDAAETCRRPSEEAVSKMRTSDFGKRVDSPKANQTQTCVSRRTFAGEASPTLEVSIHFPVRTDWGHQ